VSVYPLVEAEKAEGGNVAKCCALMEVSRSAYYDWSKHRPSRRQLADAELLEKIYEVFDASRRTYGWPRVHAALRRAGTCASRKRVARLMAQAGLVGRCQRRKTRTTFPDAEAKALDLVKRAFGPGVELDRTWVGDITYVRTWEGWLYMASVIDLASRRVVGWAMADHMRAELVCDALSMAIGARRLGAGLIFRSDRGSQGRFNWSSQHQLVEPIIRGR
jgi:putative transposase